MSEDTRIYTDEELIILSQLAYFNLDQNVLYKDEVLKNTNNDTVIVNIELSDLFKSQGSKECL